MPILLFFPACMVVHIYSLYVKTYTLSTIKYVHVIQNHITSSLTNITALLQVVPFEHKTKQINNQIEERCCRRGHKPYEVYKDSCNVYNTTPGLFRIHDLKCRSLALVAVYDSIGCYARALAPLPLSPACCLGLRFTQHGCLLIYSTCSLDSRPTCEATRTAAARLSTCKFFSALPGYKK